MRRPNLSGILVDEQVDNLQGRGRNVPFGFGTEFLEGRRATDLSEDRPRFFPPDSRTPFSESNLNELNKINIRINSFLLVINLEGGVTCLSGRGVSECASTSLHVD